ncbi:MAG: tetratricopeptide repeat protein [Sulfobacillus sp.]|nr:tetratricopeptide repeat protein [Sulfobacillus sp.]
MTFFTTRTARVATLVLGAVGVLTGCGTTSHPQSAPKPHHAVKTTAVRQPGSGALIEGGAPYYGSANLKHYVGLAEAHPTSVSAWYNAAKAEFVNGQFAQAVTDYQKAIALDSNNSILWNNLANIYFYTEKKPQEALPLYQKAVSLNAQNVIAWYNLSQCEAALKESALSVQTAKLALTTVKGQSANVYYKALEQIAQASAGQTAPKS